MSTLFSKIVTNVKKAAAQSKPTSAAKAVKNKTSAAKSTVNKVASAVNKAATKSVASGVSKAVASAAKNQNTTATKLSNTAAVRTTSTGGGKSGSSASSSSGSSKQPPTMEEYLKSGFYTSSNIPALQEQLAAYNIPDATVRSQAEAMYKPTYDMQKTAFENQLAQLGTDRDREIKSVNSQYDRTLNSVMVGLNSRNLGRSSLVATRGVETENARNAAVSDVSYNYLQKENQLNANLQQAEAEYAQNVENKAAEITEKNRAQKVALMAQIAQLQSSGYSAYVNYILSKNK